MNEILTCLASLACFASPAYSATLHGTIMISLNTEKLNLPAGAMPPQEREVWVKGPKIRIEEVLPDDSTSLVVTVFDGQKGYRFSRARPGRAVQ
jgi:hypothetical protein